MRGRLSLFRWECEYHSAPPPLSGGASDAVWRIITFEKFLDEWLHGRYEDEERENAVEDVEIDQSSELYQTIVAAIMEDTESEANIRSKLEEEPETIQSAGGDT